MTGNEYQALAMRTNDGKSTDRVISGVLTCDLKWLHNQNVVREDTEGLDLGGVLNGCLGLAGESGEVLDMVKKCIFHEKKMDKYHLKKELGDVIREWGLNFNLGSAVKYIARAGRKDDIVQDLKKAREFLSFEIEALEAESGRRDRKATSSDVRGYGSITGGSKETDPGSI